MFSKFFIDHPIFTWVLAITIMGLGLLAVPNLPIQPYPSVAPPQVSINANYPGASAETIDKTITQRIEQNLIAIDNLRYIQSSSSSSGRAEIRLTFDIDANPDIAQVQTQNKLSQALSNLPAQVRQLGIPVEKSSGFYAVVVAAYSPGSKMDDTEIGDFVASNLVEPIGRIKGVGRINAFAPQHALRIWLNPRELFNYKLTATDVINAVRAQNNQVASGQIGAAPAVEGQKINATVTSQSLFSTREQFENILLRTLPNGESVRVGDIARVEIGAENYSSIRRYKRKPASGFGVSLASDANALETVDLIKERLKELEPTFPKDLKIAYPVDVTPFIRASIWEVVITLVLAMFLVIAVMYVFLQNIRSTLVPGIAIPVVILGTFASLWFFQYSINILTLFALVLAIGLLVDDAIVVTENIKRSLEEDSELDSKQAAYNSMKELTGALVGTTVVLWAVFVPMLLFAGSTGVIYKQFAVTLISAMTLSLFVALTFTPSLCATLFKKKESMGESKWFGWFNSAYDKSKNTYEKWLKYFLNHTKLAFLSFLAVIILIGLCFFNLPSAFLPNEDQGNIYVLLEGPPTATFEEMKKPISKVEDFFLADRLSGSIKDIFTVRGFSFSGSGQNAAIGFVHTVPYDEREGPFISIFEIADMARKELSAIRDAKITVIVPPPIRDLGRATGFEFQLVDRTGQGRENLVEVKDEFLAQLNQSPEISYSRFNSLGNSPQYKINIDYEKAKALGVSVASVNETLSAAWGTQYVNDFIEKDRVKRVFVQGDAPFRMKPGDLGDWYVRSQSGAMVSFSDFSKGYWDYGPPQVERFNGSAALPIQGQASPGFSTGDAMERIMKVADNFKESLSVEWVGLSYEEQQSGDQVYYLYMITVLAIFLSLAALYESWAIPFAIILTIPMGIVGAALLSLVSGQTNDVYFKVGILLAMGLAAKNAILIVEFAITAIKEGKCMMDAIMQASQQRFRPILMTSFTFLLGVLPLVFASGPGSGAQQSIGFSLVGGILSTTLLVIFFAPLFFLFINRNIETVEDGSE